jgi:hypothetical protein
MFFYPWYPALMLAVECHNVIDMRLWKMAAGGVHAAEESQLMVTEKVSAAIEASAMLATGKGPGEVIDFYRRQVAVNARRLA